MLNSEEEISSIAEGDDLDYDKQDFEDIQFEQQQDASQIQEESNESENEEQVENKSKYVNKAIKFQIPKHIEEKQKQILAFAETAFQNLNNISNYTKRPQSSSYKPVYTQSINAQKQQQKKFNYQMKSFNTLPKKSDPVARYQQMSKMWKQNKFLNATKENQKQGRKLELDQRIELQKQQLRESGMFHKYITKSQLFL